MMRVGFSKDIHRLVVGRKLMICGVDVPSTFGELAHSDGDVAYHALAEAMLGALALGDLGSHFPDSDDRYLNIDSGLIVTKVNNMIKEKGYHVNNVDIFISLEKPKLKDYIAQMRNNVASLLGISLDAVSIKAGTNEKLDAVGKNQAIEAYAIVSLEN